MSKCVVCVCVSVVRGATGEGGGWCGEEERKKENVSTCPCFRIRKVSVKQT